MVYPFSNGLSMLPKSTPETINQYQHKQRKKIELLHRILAVLPKVL